MPITASNVIKCLKLPRKREIPEIDGAVRLAKAKRKKKKKKKKEVTGW